MGEKGKQTREQILEAAVALFAEKGFDAAGIRELSERAGVPKSLLYYHFKNKEAILHDLIGSFFVEMEGVFYFLLQTSVPGAWDFTRVATEVEALFTCRGDDPDCFFRGLSFPGAAVGHPSSSGLLPDPKGGRA